MSEANNIIVILAYNEEAFIENTISEISDLFESIFVVNDKSTDSTLKILNEIRNKNKKVKIINNNSNFGPGKSMQIGINEALKNDFKYLVKVDGDNQFDKNDIKNLLLEAEKLNADYIKCDRFWLDGVKGEIPKIRYFGNAFASMLIKLLTGNKKINDPLNGLFLFSKDVLKNLNIPKFFNRYGYPFFINAKVVYLSIGRDLNLYQYKNVITYGDEKSKLNPISVFLKLLTFTVVFFTLLLRKKIKYSTHQISGIIDFFAIICLLSSLFSFFMFINSRYFEYSGNQGAWILLFVIFLITFFVLLFQSQKTLSEINTSDFEYLN